jgi:hypothetical protein
LGLWKDELNTGNKLEVSGAQRVRNFKEIYRHIRDGGKNEQMAG